MTNDTGSIVTVNGRIDPDDLGITLTHEHTFVDLRNWFNEPESAYARKIAEQPVSLENLWYIRRNAAQNKDNQVLGSMEEAIDEISRYYRAGGQSIIDVTPKAVGQDPQRVREVGRETGVQFVQGTAFYVRSGHPDRVDDMTLEEIEDEFVHDIVEGIGNSSIRAGIVGEIGLSGNEDGNIYDEEIKVLRAGARAARRTGASLTIHPPGRLPRAQRDRTYPTSRWSLEVLDIVEEEGLPAERVVMDHMDRTVYENIEYQKELASRGAYLEYDLWGSEFYWDHWNDGYPSDWWRADAVTELIDEGYGSQLLFSHDVCLKIHRTKYGGFGYAHVLNNVVPMLRNKGVTKEQINEILIENPRRMLTFEEPAE